MLAQLFILSPRGDNIIFRDYRGDVPKTSPETFFRKYRFWKTDEEEDAPPIFNVDGVNYIHIKGSGILFVATTRSNVSPSMILELLHSISRVTKDYLGVLNEDSLRKNFVLVYELLDEMVDFGYPQCTSTEFLKSYVFNEPISEDSVALPSFAAASIFMAENMLWQQGGKRVPGTAVTKSVVANDPSGMKREEIFVDVIEKISVTFSSSGYVLTSEIDGTIRMKSFLTGNPEIRLGLNEDLGIGQNETAGAAYGTVILDDCNFHESVRTDSFDIDRSLSLVPPNGEFTVMNYRMTQEVKLPFRVHPVVEVVGPYKVEVIVKLRAEFPSNVTASSVVLRIPLPKSTSRVTCDLDQGALGQSTDFRESAKMLEWTMKKITGRSEYALRAKLTLTQEHLVNARKETGPINMTFSIPMFNSSRLQVRYLHAKKNGREYNPYRWVRYLTEANSYVIRL